MKIFKFLGGKFIGFASLGIVVLLFYQNCANQFQAINGLNAQNYSSMQAQKTISELEVRNSIGYKSTNRDADFERDPLFLDRMTLFIAGPSSSEIVNNELFTLNSGGAENDQYLVQFTEDRKSVLIYRKSDPNNYIAYQIPLPQNFGRFVLAINFKQKPGMEKLMLNGSIVNANYTTTGLPGDSNYLIKEVAQDQSVQSLLAAEDLTWYEMNMISSMIAQQSGVLNFKIDFTLSNNEVTFTPNEVETRALSLIQSRCATCHEQHGSWSGYSTNNFISQGMIVPGDPSNSKIYQRITSSDTANRMPPGGGLGVDDPQIIRAWIMNSK